MCHVGNVIEMNPLNLVTILGREFQDWKQSKLTIQEEEFALTLKDLIMQAIDFGVTVVERVNDLVLDTYGVENPEPIYDPESDDVNFQIDPEDSAVLTDGIPLTYKRKAVNFWRGAGKSSRKFSQVKNKFKLLTQVSQLYRWEKQVEAGGVYKETLLQISKHTYEKFQEAKRNHQLIKTLDLRRIALGKARELNCTHFKASCNWATNFKKRHGIVSRKITKFVSKKDVQEKGKIEEAVLEYVLETQAHMADKDLDYVVNTDQSGFQLELHSGRTLSERGIKRVEIVSQSKNALTHSYTIMPTMTASGKLIEPMYIVLREPAGSFGPNVRENMLRPPNLLISCSTSGKMGKTHLAEYTQGVLVPYFRNLNFKPTLLCDAWSTFTEANIKSSLPVNMDMEILQIPAGGTGICQPWDVRGFRIYKNFVRHISDFVILCEVPVTLHQRDSVLKMQSLVYNQLCSPRYYPMFQSS